MRVLVAPDSFGGSLTAVQATRAIAAGWQSVAPGDRLELIPLSDGGAGLCDALTAGLADTVTVRPGLVRVGDTAYVESAVGCGPDAVRAAAADVRTGSTYDVGRLVAQAGSLPGVTTVVVGLGGSATNDGGAGLWAALGAEPAELLRGGGAGLGDLDRVVPPRVRTRLVVATDVSNPLLGPDGATAVYGPQKGADPAAIEALEAALHRWADVVEAAVERPGLRDRPGAGAAGGLGFGLLALGGERVAGLDLVAEAVRLGERLRDADLVLTGEGRFDATSLRGKVVAGVARLAQRAGVPCVVLAGEVAVARREAAAHGVDEIWAVADLLGSVEVGIVAGADGLQQLAVDVAHAWAR